MLSVPLAASGQSATAPPATRAEELRRQQEEKARNLKPVDLPWPHDLVLWIRRNKVPEKFAYGVNGFRPLIGSLGPGSGIAFGVEYQKERIRNTNILLRTSISASLQEFFMVDFQLGSPADGARRTFWDVATYHMLIPSIFYYGTGPDSPSSPRTAYSLKENSLGGFAGVKIRPRFGLGAGARYLTTDPGLPRDSTLPTQDVFTPQQSPALDQALRFVIPSFFVGWRRLPGSDVPQSGGSALAQYSFFSDQKLGQFSFQRIDFDLQYRRRFLNDQRGFFLWGRTMLNKAIGGNQVPFYLEARLGGPFDLRGFPGMRFYDDNKLILNGEYSFRIAAPMDLAIFMDAGKVFPRWSQLNLHSLEKSYGMGIRMYSKRGNLAHFDLAWSREGFHAWFLVYVGAR